MINEFYRILNIMFTLLNGYMVRYAYMPISFHILNIMIYNTICHILYNNELNDIYNILYIYITYHGNYI